MMVACGQPEQFGQDHARLRVPVVVRLQPGEDQIERFVFDRRRESLGGVEGIQAHKFVVFQVDGAIRAFRDGFPQHLLGAGWPAGDDHYFTLMLFPLPQSLFQRVGIRLVDLVRDLFADPGARFVELERCVFLRHLLHANQDFQE